ncbi:unnamed protein product [Periconia digitata]|uniref:Uncharacterized protein n=1 Tax=Periconia digitata TaxID=1303443 RepID=A0A9W4UBL7_9PLEO|nr:unnamed protein product [Periconia digitata]
MLLSTLLSLLPFTYDPMISIFDKIGFDLDVIGRQREIAFIEDQATTEYTKAGMNVNVAVWNMHVPVRYSFDDKIESGFKPMGRGGGFRVVVFRGGGYITNLGSGGPDNWLCTGNTIERGNVVEFRPVERSYTGSFSGHYFGGLQLPEFI